MCADYIRVVCNFPLCYDFIFAATELLYLCINYIICLVTSSQCTYLERYNLVPLLVCAPVLLLSLFCAMPASVTSKKLCSSVQFKNRNLILPQRFFLLLCYLHKVSNTPKSYSSALNFHKSLILMFSIHSGSKNIPENKV